MWEGVFMYAYLGTSASFMNAVILSSVEEKKWYIINAITALSTKITRHYYDNKTSKITHRRVRVCTGAQKNVSL